MDNMHVKINYCFLLFFLSSFSLHFVENLWLAETLFVIIIIDIPAVGAGVIYRAVTLQQAGRRKRGARDDTGAGGDLLTQWLHTLNTARAKFQ